MGQLSDGSKDPGCSNGTTGREVDREGCVGVGESDTATVSGFLKNKDTEFWGVCRPVVAGGRGRERRRRVSNSSLACTLTPSVISCQDLRSSMLITSRHPLTDHQFAWTQGQLKQTS